MKALVVFSGGMDSATALFQAVRSGMYSEVATVSFDYGSKHNDREWSYATKFCDLLNVSNVRVSLDFVASSFKSDLLKTGGDIPEGHYADPSMQRTVVPFRNGIMLAIAAGLAESNGLDCLVLGNHFGDHAVYPDCRKSFIEPMAAAIAAGTYAAVKVVSPFCAIDKTEIVRIGTRLGVPYELTYSCYNGRPNHCGKCGTCYERKEAFSLAGFPDPTGYEA
jgi:7-cyano-7-deazaguanine synthase